MSLQLETSALQRNALPAQDPAPSRLTVLAVLALPPPLHGQSAINAGMVAFLAEAPAIDLSVVDVAPRVGAGWWAYHRSRALAYGRAMAQLFTKRRAGSRSLYAVYEPGLGALYTLALVALARCLGFGIALHHHSGRLSREWGLDLAVMTWLGGQAMLHIVLDDAMAQDLRQRYRPKRAAFVLCNAAFIDTPLPPVPVRIPDRILRLGHLSNLSLEKGLDRFLSCGFGPDGTARTDRRLVLAGAPSTPEANEALEKAALVLGDTLETHGAVSGERKAAFFRDIDLFVFPSLYRHEAQPLVALEALAYGKPVIALGFGYLAGLVGSTGGIVLPPRGAFAHLLDAALARLSSAPGGLAAASVKARARFEALRATGLRQRKALPDALRAIAATSPGERA